METRELLEEIRDRSIEAMETMEGDAALNGQDVALQGIAKPNGKQGSTTCTCKTRISPYFLSF